MKNTIWTSMILIFFFCLVFFWYQFTKDKRRNSILYVKPVIEEVTSLDPAKMRFRTETKIGRALYGQLLSIDETGRVAPGIFSEWTTDNDFKTYTFLVDPSSRFSDGSLLRVEDIIDSMHHLARSESVINHHYNSIEGIYDFRSKKTSFIRGIEKISSKKIKISMKTSSPNFIRYMADLRSGVIPSERLQNDPTFKNPIGGGRYRLSKWEREKGKIEIIRGDNNLGSPNSVKTYIFQVVDRKQAIEGFLKGRFLDLEAYNVSKTEIDRAHEFSSYAIDSRTTGLFINDRRHPWKSIDYRKALVTLISPSSLVARCFNGLDRAWSMIPPGSPGHSKIPRFEKFSPELRRLSEWQKSTNGRPIRFVQIPDAPHECFREYLKTRSRDTGIDFEYELIDFNEAEHALKNGIYDVFTEYLTLRDSEPLTLFSLVYGKSDINLSGGVDPAFDSLYEEALRTLDRNIRIDIYKKLDASLIENFRVYPLAHHRRFAFFDSRVKGPTNPAIIYGLTPFDSIWLED